MSQLASLDARPPPPISSDMAGVSLFCLKLIGLELVGGLVVWRWCVLRCWRGWGGGSQWMSIFRVRSVPPPIGTHTHTPYTQPHPLSSSPFFLFPPFIFPHALTLGCVLVRPQLRRRVSPPTAAAAHEGAGGGGGLALCDYVSTGMCSIR